MTIGEIIDERAAASFRLWRNPPWGSLLITLPWLLGLVFLIHESRVDRAIAARQQTTQGTITVHEPSNHNRYGYRFTVKGRAYTGWESPRSTELEIGKVVTVYYDPANPNKNALTDFNDLSADSLGPVPLMVLGICGVTIFIILRRRRNGGSKVKRRENTE